MKNKAQTTFVTVLLLGVVLCIVMYMYFYKPTNEKCDALEESNAALQTRVDELEKFYNEMPENKKKIEAMTAGIKEIAEKFPSEVREEDALYFAISSMRLDNVKEMYQNGTISKEEQFDYDFYSNSEENKVDYAAITISPTEQLAIVDGSMVESANIEGFLGQITFNKREVNYQNITDYESLKILVQGVNASPEKRTVSKLAYTTDEEGVLTGNFAVTFYSLQGTDKEYVEKDFGEFEYGLENVFVEAQ